MSENVINTIGSGAPQIGQAGKPAESVSFRAETGNSRPVPGKASPAREASIRAQALDTLVEELNSRSRSIGRSIRFQVDPGSTTPIIQVFDRDSGRLIRQIPADQAAVIARNRETLDLGRVIDVV